jgi:hypothetical protein
MRTLGRRRGGDVESVGLPHVRGRRRHRAHVAFLWNVPSAKVGGGRCPNASFDCMLAGEVVKSPEAPRSSWSKRGGG